MSLSYWETVGNIPDALQWKFWSGEQRIRWLEVNGLLSGWPQNLYNSPEYMAHSNIDGVIAFFRRVIDPSTVEPTDRPPLTTLPMPEFPKIDVPITEPTQINIGVIIIIIIIALVVFGGNII